MATPPPLIFHNVDDDTDNEETPLSPVAHVSSPTGTGTSSFLDPSAAQTLQRRSSSGRWASSSSMATELDTTAAPGASENGVAAGSAEGQTSPFNFETQFISTSPVKSVSRPSFLPGSRNQANPRLPSRTLVNAAATATSTPPSRLNITSSKNHRLGPHQSCPPPSPCQLCAKPGPPCTATSAPGYTGVYAMPSSHSTSSSPRPARLP